MPLGLGSVLDSLRTEEYVLPEIERGVVKRVISPNLRSAGHHPSGVHFMCARFNVINALVRPEEKVIDRPTTHLQRLFDYGSTLHKLYQEQILGPTGVLWGKWRCSRCYTVQWGFIPEDSCGDCQRVEHITCTSEYPDVKHLTPKRCLEICKTREEGKFYDFERIKLRGGCNWCSEWGKWEYLEVPLRMPGEINGTADGLIWVKDRWILLELKSQNDKLFEGRTEPLPQWVAQVQAYMCILDNMYQNQSYFPHMEEVFNHSPARTASIVVINKNNSKEAEFVVHYDKEYGEELIQRFETVNAAMENEGVLPKRSEDCADELTSRAKRCPHRHVCFSKEEMTTEDLKRVLSF